LHYTEKASQKHNPTFLFFMPAKKAVKDFLLREHIVSTEKEAAAWADELLSSDAELDKILSELKSLKDDLTIESEEDAEKQMITLRQKLSKVQQELKDLKYLLSQ
jgi:hypothetical protein